MKGPSRRGSTTAERGVVYRRDGSRRETTGVGGAPRTVVASRQPSRHGASSSRRISPIRPRSPLPPSSNRRRESAAGPFVQKSRASSPRPLLDELFGFGGDPYDEEFLDRPPTTIFAATHFSQLQKQHQPPPPPASSSERRATPSRRRTRSEMGYYVPALAPSSSRGSHHTTTTIPVTSSESSGGEPTQRRSRNHHRQHHHSQQGGRRHRSSSADSRRRRSRKAKSFDTEEAVRGCVRNSFSLTRQFTSCIMSTADIYDDECKPSMSSSLRGGAGRENRLSSHNQSAGATKFRSSSNNSVEDEDDEDDDEENDTDDTETAFTGTKSGGPSVARNEDYPVGAAPSSTKPQPRNVSPDLPTGRSSPQRPNSPASGHLPEAPAAKNERDVAAHAVVPPEDNVSEEKKLEDETIAKAEALAPASPAHVVEQGIETTVNENGALLSTPTLREVRMTLFHQDFRGSISPDQTLQMQSEIDALRAQLEHMQVREVQQSDVSDLRQNAATVSTEKLVLERLQLEEKLRHEMKRNELLNGRVSEAEGRNADLMNALTNEKLKNAKLVVAKRSGNGGDTGLLSRSTTMDADDVITSPGASVFGGASSAVGTDASNAFISTVLVALKADLVQARAELAEAHAARLSAEHAQSDLAEKLHSKDVATTALKSLITDLERQKEELQCKAGNMMDSHKLLTKKLEVQLSELNASLTESTDNVAALSAEKSQLERGCLESKGEAEQLREELDSLKQELEEARREHERRIERDEETVRRLRDEVKSLNEKLLHSSAMVMSQAAEHVKDRRRFDEELAEARRFSQAIKARARRGDGGDNFDDQALDGDAKSTTSTATGSTGVSGLRKFMTRNVSQDVADLLQRSKSFQSS